MNARRYAGRPAGVGLGLLVLVPLLAACGPTVTAPDVVGMRLDAAHRKFEALEVEGFDDKDVIGEEEEILWDSNWVVVKQTPAAGTKEMDTDTTVKLEVGNEDDKKVLSLIPSTSPFAREMAKKTAEKKAEAVEKAKADEADREAAEKKAEAEKKPKASASPSPTINPGAVACARRRGNPGEIYAWNSYGNDQPPDVTRLGEGFVWDFGDKKCITSTEFALKIVADLPGYCTEVAKVTSNPGYNEDARPAPRLNDIIGQRGDC